MQKLYIHNPLFRLFAPIIYGLLVYFLILMFFGTVGKLAENFFTFEVLFCILITYLVFELQRITINQINRFIKHESFIVQMLIQFSACVIVVALLVSLIISLYYKYLIGFTSFRKELIIFNMIYFFTCLVYNLVYFSYIFLTRTNEVKIKQANDLMESLQVELDEYKSKVNPDFLYRSLEDLIVLTRTDKQTASTYIQNLSDLYRYVLSSKRNEPVEIQREVESVYKLIDLLNIRYENRINLECEIDLSENWFLIPGTLLILIQQVLERSIISRFSFLQIRLNLQGHYLILESNSCKKLEANIAPTDSENLNKSYLFYTGKEIVLNESDNKLIYTVPLVRIYETAENDQKNK